MYVVCRPTICASVAAEARQLMPDLCIAEATRHTFEDLALALAKLVQRVAG
jgi:hypothetical protein